jgi:hypothetical protein
MENISDREKRLGLRTVIETEAHRQNKRLVWWQMVTIESSGIRHVLTPWKEATPAHVRKIAKLEGVAIEPKD